MDDTEEIDIPQSEMSVAGIPPKRRAEILRSFQLEEAEVDNLSLTETVERFLKKETA